MQQSDGRSQVVADTHGVHAISAAAELVGTGMQNLRAYEARGLVQPSRTAGGTRRYSEQDIARLRHVAALLDDGLNLAGVGLVLALEAENQDLRRENTALRSAALGDSPARARTSRPPKRPDISRRGC